MSTTSQSIISTITPNDEITATIKANVIRFSTESVTSNAPQVYGSTSLADYFTMSAMSVSQETSSSSMESLSESSTAPSSTMIKSTSATTLKLTTSVTTSIEEGGVDLVLIVGGVIVIVLLIALVATVIVLMKTRSVLLEERDMSSNRIERRKNAEEKPQYPPVAMSLRENPCYESLGGLTVETSSDISNNSTPKTSIQTSPVTTKAHSDSSKEKGHFQKTNPVKTVENVYYNTSMKDDDPSVIYPHKTTRPSQLCAYEEVYDVRQEYKRAHGEESNYDDVYNRLDEHVESSTQPTLAVKRHETTDFFQRNCENVKKTSQPRAEFVLYDEVHGDTYSHLKKDDGFI